MSAVRIAALGYGNIGATLAGRFAALGHQVTLARHPAQPGRVDEVIAGRADLTGVRAADAAEAVRGAELVLLAVPFGEVPALLSTLRDDLTGRILLDATNPVGPGLTHGLAGARAGSRVVADAAPGARVVKAFSVYGWENLAAGAWPTDGPRPRPVMPYAGDDADAAEVVAGLVESLGFTPLHVGGVDDALALEFQTLLWVRLVRVGGRSPYLTWTETPR